MRCLAAAWRARASALALLLLVGLATLPMVTYAASSQRNFNSPQEAVDALLSALRSHDPAALVAVLGPAKDWLFSGDRVADHARADRFVALYEAKHTIAVDGDKATLAVGDDDYPFAFPLVRSGMVWHFDTEAGKEQMLARRIGENELSAIQTLRAVVDAQMEYASEDRNGNGVLEYAQKFASSPGKHDGLWWPTKAGETPSPLGSLVGKASREGYRRDKAGAPTPYHGYYFRLLKGQGSNAASGALDYVVRGRAIGGFAVLAYPAKYGNTGIMTFAVNQDGKVYQTDLGPNTLTAARAIQRFDPGKGWSAVTPP